jgi:predicted nucleotidyltransferase
MQAEAVIKDTVNRIKQVPGIIAIVLGGSRARGTHTSKSDIDIGIYYDCAENFDIHALQKVASDLDDSHRENTLTEINGWGTWVNGGGWLTVNHYPVDFLYRDINKVSSVMDQCLQGKLTIDYYPGHPHGFINLIYLSEIALCQILWDPNEVVLALKNRTASYSHTLKKSLIEKFLWEAAFSLSAASKSVERRDASYASGCCFRAISCLNQTLFAMNECYWMNEKGAVQIANTFAITPMDYENRTNDVFNLISSDSKSLEQAIHLLQEIIQETERLCEAFV